MIPWPVKRRRRWGVGSCSLFPGFEEEDIETMKKQSVRRVQEKLAWVGTGERHCPLGEF